MSREHIAAFERELDAKMFARKIGADQEGVKFIEGTNPENYFDAYTLRITPEMGNKPFKIYKKLLKLFFQYLPCFKGLREVFQKMFKNIRYFKSQS